MGRYVKIMCPNGMEEQTIQFITGYTRCTTALKYIAQEIKRDNLLLRDVTQLRNIRDILLGNYEPTFQEKVSDADRIGQLSFLISNEMGNYEYLKVFKYAIRNVIDCLKSKDRTWLYKFVTDALEESKNIPVITKDESTDTEMAIKRVQDILIAIRDDCGGFPWQQQ